METKIYHVDAQGNKVADNDVSQAYQINPSDPNSQKFLDALKGSAVKAPVSAGPTKPAK